MPAVEFDFQRYVARRKGAREAQMREGASYAFSGDLRFLRTMTRLRPVALAMEEMGRLWREVARAELLGTSIRASHEHFPQVLGAAARCAAMLHIDTPTVYVAPQPRDVGVMTLGTAEDVYIVLSAGLLASLTEHELSDVMGRECGRIQNGHVPFLTALYYLRRRSAGFLAWVVRPATITLFAWARRAVITADRAGLLCSRDLDVSLCAMRKAAVDAEDPDLPRRQRALERFSRSSYYKTVAGIDPPLGESREDMDAAVTEILRDRSEGMP